MDPNLTTLQDTSELLCSLASGSRADSLKEEVSGIQQRSEVLQSRLTNRIQELQDGDQKWTDFLTKMDDFSDWLKERDAALRSVQESEAAPDEKFEHAKVG